eukprot:TRINITY_DN56592_c0_g1_i1.p1 TRINITY_DN56592_c0_g1~~TRINITY_DN56592_c0_g1_i1.p1  ORF type:complete len:292 (+),score=69.72 TRINITY_DN56592_c0_g1_i1:116-991(+)
MSWVESLDVIFAEDEEMFQDIGKRAFKGAGLEDSQVHLAEDGQEAVTQFEKLSQAGGSGPLLMLVDVCMPVMDGKKCMEEVRKMIGKAGYSRHPYIVGCSSLYKDVRTSAEAKEECNGFDMIMPKPLTAANAKKLFERHQVFHQEKGGGSAATGGAAAAGGSKADGPMAVEDLDVILAHDVPICQMAINEMLGRCGIDQDKVKEVSDEAELKQALQESKALGAPVLLLLGGADAKAWLEEVAGQPATFLVLVSELGDKAEDKGQAHAVLSNYQDVDQVSAVINESLAALKR